MANFPDILRCFRNHPSLGPGTADDSNEQVESLDEQYVADVTLDTRPVTPVRHPTLQPSKYADDTEGNDDNQQQAEKKRTESQKQRQEDSSHSGCTGCFPSGFGSTARRRSEKAI